MSVAYAEEIATDKAFPHIAVYRTYMDGVQNGWRLATETGYVMYDKTDNNTQLDPDTMEEIPVTYYYAGAELPLHYRFSAFPWVAVPRDSVDESCVFGAGTNSHPFQTDQSNKGVLL